MHNAHVVITVVSWRLRSENRSSPPSLLPPGLAVLPPQCPPPPFLRATAWDQHTDTTHTIQLAVQTIFNFLYDMSIHRKLHFINSDLFIAESSSVDFVFHHGSFRHSESQSGLTTNITWCNTQTSSLKNENVFPYNSQLISDPIH